MLLVQVTRGPNVTILGRQWMYQGRNPQGFLMERIFKKTANAGAEPVPPRLLPLPCPQAFTNFTTDTFDLATKFAIQSLSGLRHPRSMIGFLPRSVASSIQALPLIVIIAQVAHAHEHSHRRLYKARTDHSATTKHRTHNFTLVDRYEGKTFFECVVVHPSSMTSILCPSTDTAFSVTGISSLLTIRRMAWSNTRHKRKPRRMDWRTFVMMGSL